MDRNVLVKRNNRFCAAVVPYVGTWIEISHNTQSTYTVLVVPYVGTWIEIEALCAYALDGEEVVPYVGTWIEI